MIRLLWYSDLSAFWSGWESLFLDIYEIIYEFIFWFIGTGSDDFAD